MRHPFLTPTVAMIIGLSAISGVSVAQAQTAPDAAPIPLLSYQGRLLEGSNPANGSRSFVFALKDVSGNELWNSSAQTLTVVNGLYSVVLGSTGMTPIPVSVLSRSDLKLNVVIGGVPMIPDVDLVAAFQARSAWELVGEFSGDLTGTQNQTLVSKIQGIAVDLTTTAPTTGQALIFNGTKFVPGAVSGSVGPQGQTGPQGLTGATGPQGPQGNPGVAGASGAIGPQGPIGLTGTTGPQGPSGLIGPQGLIGATGLQGPIGVSPLTLNGSNAVFTTGSLGLGTTTPDASSLLDLTSTTLGFLPPRMTSVQRAAIITPIAGLMVYQTDGTPGLYQFNGVTWAQIGASGGSGTVTSVSGSAPIAVATGTTTPVISLAKATGTTDGYLAAADFAAFNAKGSGTVTSVSGSGGTTGLSLTGGSITTNGTLTLGGTLNVANGGTGATTLASGSYLVGNGASAVSLKTPAQVTADLSVMVGDSGAGGNKGLVPAPAAGDAAANKFLKANGTWAVAGGGSSPWTTTGNDITNSNTGYVAINKNLILPNATGGANAALQIFGSDGTTRIPFLHAFGGGNGAGGANVFLGIYAGNFTLSAQCVNNVGIGYGALSSLAGTSDQTGLANVAVGFQALSSNTDGSSNLALGMNSLQLNTTGNSNIAIGSLALLKNTTGTGNTAVGDQALRYSVGNDHNSAFGAEALYGNTGDQNNAFGYRALRQNGAGTSNNAFGSGSLQNNTTGSNNLALGDQAGFFLTTGSYNIHIGHSGLAADTNTLRLGTAYDGSTTGQNKAFIAGIYGVTPGGATQTVVIDANGQLGSAPSAGGGGGGVTSVATGTGLSGGPITTTGTIALANTAVTPGTYTRASLTVDPQGRLTAASSGATISLIADVAGTLPVANGGTGLANPGTTGNVLTSNGSTWVSAAPSGIPSQTGNSGKYLTTNGTTAAWNTALVFPLGANNTAGGASAMAAMVGTNAVGNTALGSGTMRNLTGNTVNGGTGNTAVGINALLNLTDTSAFAGYANVGIGASAGQAITTGTRNTAIGYLAMGSPSGTSLTENVAVGYQSLVAATTGNYNLAVGSNSLNTVTTGSQNIGLGGRNAGNALTTGSNNIAIGYATIFGSAAASNQILIGNGATGTADYQMVLGGPGAAGAWNGALTQVVPGKDATASLGSATNRWTTVYAGNVDVTGSFTVNGSPISSGSGTVSSVALSGGSTGLTASGTPITSSGTITLGGTLAIANGGTGAITATGALASLLPTQFGNGGLFLTTDGSGTVSWASAAGGGGSWSQILPKATGAAGAAIQITKEDNSTTRFLHAFGSTNGVAANNLFLGSGAGNFSMASDSTDNTGIGAGALAGLANTAAGNTALGSQAMALGGLSASNTAVGFHALTGGAGTQGSTEGTAIGYNSQAGNLGGGGNTSIGSHSLEANTYGSNNTGLGQYALGALTNATFNVAVGVNAGLGLTTGGSNVAVGTMALQLATGTVSNNVAVGQQSLLGIKGAGNTAVGTGSLAGNPSTGDYNVALGYNAGYKVAGQNGGYNTIIGSNSRVSDASGQIALGSGAVCSLANQLVLGGDGSGVWAPALTQVIPGKNNSASLGSLFNKWTAVYSTNGTIQTSDERVKRQVRPIDQGLATLMRLQPKIYFKHDSQFQDGRLLLEASGREEAGFLAQEVAGIIPTAVHRPEDEQKALWGMNYEQILPYAVKAVQELQTENTALKAELAGIQADLAKIKALLKL